jgi:predicted RND superfamily exporter protein
MKWLGILFYLALQVMAVASWRGLGQGNGETLFFSEKGLKSYQEFLKNFEEQKPLLVKATFPSSLDEAGYQGFRRAVQGLKDEFPDVEIVTVFDAYRPSLKQDDLKTIREFLTGKPDLSFHFVGPDHLVFLATFADDVTPGRVRAFVSRLQNQEFFGRLKLQMAGLPYINDRLDLYSEDINTQLFPILFLVVFLATLAFTRDFLTSLVLFVPALGSLNLTMALVKWLYASMNMVTSVVPLLIFVLNLSLAFHFFFAVREYGSFRRAFSEKRAPFLLMIAATAIGFGSLSVSDIPAIRQFGILSFPAILLSAALTFLWAACVFPSRAQKKVRESTANRQDGIPVRLFERAWKRSAILAIALILTAAGLVVLTRIPINTDVTTYFPKKSGLEKSIRGLESELMGVPILEVVLSKGGGELSYDDLLAVDRLESDLLEASGGRRRILSANALVKEANYVYTGEKRLPPLEISYWTLKSQAIPSLQLQYPRSPFYRLTYFGPTMDDRPYRDELDRIRKILDRYPQFQATFNGIYNQIMKSQSPLIWILVATFLLRLLVIAVLFHAYFRRPKLLAVFLLSNELPVLACVLFLWACRFSLNVATVMMFPVSIGIVVGNTIHIIHALAKKERPSFEIYVRTVGVPVLIGSCTLVLGFAVMGFYGFVPIRQFGTSLAFTVFCGMLSALYLVPTLVTKSADLRRVLSRKEIGP